MYNNIISIMNTVELTKVYLYNSIKVHLGLGCSIFRLIYFTNYKY